jgi:deoxyribonuclease V
MVKTRTLHRWDLPYKEAVDVQRRLCGQVRQRPLARPAKTVAGADVSYEKHGQKLYAAVLVFSLPDLVLMDQASVVDRAEFPYVPGLLSFREAPALTKAFTQIRRKPDVVIFDGQGIAHPRGMGLASHMGLILNCPSVGCAKTRLVGTYPQVPETRGSTVLLTDRGRVVGGVVRTRDRVKPVFVSVGHRITLEESIALVLDCCRGYKLPEPTRQAHMVVNRLRMQATG